MVGEWALPGWSGSVKPLSAEEALAESILTVLTGRLAKRSLADPQHLASLRPHLKRLRVDRILIEPEDRPDLDLLLRNALEQSLQAAFDTQM